MKTINVTSAAEFIDHLRLSHATWGIPVSFNDSTWINREDWAFRGQRDATWRLVPSAFRSTVRLGYEPQAQLPTLAGFSQRDQERQVLNEFLFTADRVGLEVPGDGTHFRIPQLPNHPPKPGLNAWPWDKVLETLAVAQHHGVPTRLLDFSYNPMVAGFFACYGAWEELGRPKLAEAGKLPGDQKVAVWAVRLILLYESVGYYASNGHQQRVIVVTSPRAKNSYLHNQEGIFLLNLAYDAEGYPPLDATLEDIRQEMLQRGFTQFAAEQVVKIELSFQHVPEALARLWNEFYHIARLQPTFDKVVQALKDHYDLFKP